MTVVTLRDITRENWREALELAVRPEQQRFVAEYAPIALVGLSKAYVRPLGLTWIPFAIYAGQDMVGFLELALDRSTSDQYWLYHFFIDERYQRQGFGKKALAAFVEDIERSYPQCRCISLTVQEDNLVAKRLYENAGFVRTKEETYGEPTYRLYL